MKIHHLRALCALLLSLMLLSSLLSCNQTGNEIGTDETTDITTETAPPTDTPAGEITTKTIYCKVSENHDTLPVFAELSKPYADYLANMTYEGERLTTVQLCHKFTGMPVALYEFTYEGSNPVSLTVKA